MANTSSARKAIRVSGRKHQVNLNKKNAFKEARKKITDLLKSGEVKKAEQELPNAYKKIDKASKSNAVHPNKAARLKAKLATQINAAKTK